MSTYDEDEGGAPTYQISSVTCTDVSTKPSFTALRKPTVSNFQSSNHSSLNSELNTKESFSWNPEKMKNAYKVKQSYFNQIDIFQDNEDLLREKSEVIMGRIRETLQQHAAEESDRDDDDETATEPTSFFQTDVPEESLERARHRNMVLGEEFDYGPLDMRTIVNTKVVEHYKRGIGLADRGKFEQAIVCFTRALNLRPAEVQCYIERAECHLQLCDLRSAYLNYKKAYSLEPDDQLIQDKLAFVAYLEGQCLFDQRLYSDALKRFATATRMKPDNTSYNMRAIACLAALGKSDDCLALVSRHIDAGRSNKNWANAQLFVLRARLHLQFNNASLAYYDVQDALRVDPILPQALKLLEEMGDKSESYKNQAVTLALELRFGEAISKMNLAIESNPSRAHLHIYRASLHRKVNNFNEAIDDLLLALDKCKHGESDDDDDDDDEKDSRKEDYEQAQRQLLVTYNDFSVYCYKRGFYDEAVVLLNKAIKGEKNEVGLYLNRGDCFFKLNNLDFALADYEQALELDESLWSCRCRIAIVYNEQGIVAYHQKEYEKGVMKFNEAVSNNPKVGQFYIHRARCFYVLQAFQHARDDLLMAMLLDPHNNEIVPFLSRLFPGRSVREIMESGLMEASRRRLDNLMRVTTTTPREDDQELGTTSKKLSKVNPSFETLPCQDVSKMKTNKSEGVSCLDLIHESKKNRKKVDSLLKKPLNFQRRPAVGPLVSRSAVTETAQESKPYKWKQFV